jgi:hypothetical protein
MLTINLLENKELKKEIEILKAENARLKNDKLFFEEWNKEFIKDNQELLDKVKSLSGENDYLKQKVKEYRHKTWFPVYEENLKLQQELEQYKTVLTSVETFISQYSKEKKGDKGCH